MAPSRPSRAVLPGERDAGRSLLVAVLGFALLDRSRSGAPALDVLGRWIDTWTGIGRVARAMARQGYDLQLTRYDERGWRATFYASGVEHSATAAAGSAWEATPFAAVQRAAWGALRSADR
jgi:hypothetical protein